MSQNGATHTLGGWARRIVAGLIGLGFVGGAAAILFLPLTPANAPQAVEVGQVAPQDILAPKSVTYVSQLLTEQARAAAAAAVPEVYDPPDTRVARTQVNRVQQVLDYLTSVRADSFATPEQRLTDVAAVSDLAITPEQVGALLEFDDEIWASVRGAAVSVLEQVMSRQVRADRLEDARRGLPALVSVRLSEEQADVVTAIAQSYVAPNSFYNEAATQAARQAARDAVQPASQSFVSGQVVVSRGRIVTDLDLEALDALGVRPTQITWQGEASVWLAVLLGGGVLGLYVVRYQPEAAVSPQRLGVLAVVVLVFLAGAKLMVPGRVVMPFLFPLAGLAMFLTIVLGPHEAIGASAVLAGWIGLLSDGRLDVVAYSFAGAMTAALALGRARRLNAFWTAGLACGLAMVGTILIFRLPDAATDPLGLMTLIGSAAGNGVISAGVALLGSLVFGGFFDVTTGVQLLELARPNHPLLQLVLRQAPGTYQHSLQVANLAEQAAERLGANNMLTRVGALYHDNGKALHPENFIENQTDGDNVHDRLSPEESARLIIEHVTDGLALARRYRLPRRVAAFVAEHHGTMLTTYQYRRALEAAGGDASAVDESKFRYPGPRPQSVETALLMLADGAEAIVRANRLRLAEDIDRIVKKVIDERLAQGQLDDCPLTMRDLQIVRESFVATLKGMAHGRLQYPDEKKAGRPD